MAGLDSIYRDLDALYQDLHRNPELSNREEKTAARLAARLRELGFEVTEHVEVISAETLPPGWTGKLWAMQHGVERARKHTADYFWFTDADIRQAPDTLRRLMSRAETKRLDMVSLMVADGFGATQTLHFVFNQASTGPNVTLQGTSGNDVIFGGPGTDGAIARVTLKYKTRPVVVAPMIMADGFHDRPRERNLLFTAPRAVASALASPGQVVGAATSTGLHSS